MFLHKSHEKRNRCLMYVYRRFVMCSVMRSVIGPTMWEFGISKRLLTNHDSVDNTTIFGDNGHSSSSLLVFWTEP